MEFLTPLFVAAGAIAAVGPFVLHMLRRSPSTEMPFSIVRFLKPSRPKMMKRSKIEHWPLMLMRMLALVFIGMAFARPFLREVIPSEAGTEGGEAVTILIDRSASMRRVGLKEEVENAVQTVVDDLKAADLLSIRDYSRTSRVLVDFETWAAADSGTRQAMVDDLLQSWEPDWMNTQTGSAMLAAADELAQEGGRFQGIERRRLVLVTDFQRGSQMDELKTAGWPDSVSVELRVCKPEQAGNVGLAWVEGRDGRRGQVRIQSAGDSSPAQVQVQALDGELNPVGNPVDVQIAAGQRRTIQLPAEGAKDGSVIGVQLTGDAHRFDNVVDFPPLTNPEMTVAHIGSDVINDPESMRYYLQRVLDGNPARDVQLMDLKQPVADLFRPIPADVTFAVATEPIPEAMLDSVQTLFNRGGTLLMAADSVAAISSIKDFLPADANVAEAEIEDYAMLAEIDYRHPVFQAFAEARFADFSAIRFWKCRNLMLNLEERRPGDWEVLAEFDNGMPALVQFSIGEEGRLMVLTSGWHPADSQLAVSTRFPPLLTRLLSLAVPESSTQQMRSIGSVIRPKIMMETAEWQIQFPDETKQTAAEAFAEYKSKQSDDEIVTDDDVSLVLDRPGRYLLSAGPPDARRQLTIIANVAAAESRTEPLPTGQLQALGIGVTRDGENASATSDESMAKMKTSELENRQKFWRWMLLAGLALLLLESIWATRLERRLELIE